MADHPGREAGSTGGGKAGAGRDQDSEVKTFVEALGRTITMGDGRSAARLWEVPALVLADDHVRPVSTAGEVAEHFSSAKHRYLARGITDTRADIVAVEWLTERVVMVRVRWPYLDIHADEVGEETMTYMLRRDDAGNLRLRMAVLHGEAPKH